MATTTVANGSPHLVGNGPEAGDTSTLEDPFATGHFSQHPHPHRFSSFDTQLFSLTASSSPSQVKRTLEAHIAETDRRLGDASKLGSTLLEQRQELQEKLKEIEKQQDDAELSPELRERLLELEREYNEVGRDSARAILAPKSRVVSAEDKPLPGSPAQFSSQATASPSKVSVPNRKQRNQPSSRVGDIQFAADISTSLLAQVRQLQSVLAERDEVLKTVTLEKSKLELEAEGFSQRLRALDESEQRYKDENWSLETQTHDLMATAKESSEREKKLNAVLGATLAEKTRAQNELDELKLVHGKLTDDHTAAQKAHDSEMHTLRRTLDVGDNEKSSLQNRIEELTSQNQELAKAVAARLRGGREGENNDVYGFEDEDMSRDMSTPEHSPPPSPTKGTPRHPGLESETLKSSLHHAHRMIQNLKGNIHREKTEKIELKRMLQDARDELDARRGGNGGPDSGSKKQKTRSDTFKKPAKPNMLGASRGSRTNIEMEDPEWQDHNGEASPSQAAASRYLQTGTGLPSGGHSDLSDAYHTANDTDAFETANERETATESEAFQTGAESLAGDSTDELTETEETSVRGGTIKGKSPAMLGLNQPGNRASFQSTASTSAGEDAEEVQTPVMTAPQKYRLKLNKFLNPRRSRASIGTDANSARSTAKNSPASFYDKSPPTQGGQSLFAELGEVGDDGDFSTPGRSSIVSRRSTPRDPSQLSRRSTSETPYTQPLPRAEMVDSGMMTEPWEAVKPEHRAEDIAEGAVFGGAAGILADRVPKTQDYPQASDFPLPPSHPGSPGVMDSSTQWTPLKGMQESPTRSLSSYITPPKTVWDEEHDRASPAPSAVPFSMTKVSSQETEPVTTSPEPVTAPITPPLGYSGIAAQETTPVEPKPVPAVEETRPPTAKKADVAVAAGAGLLGSMSAAFGLKKMQESKAPVIAEDETSQASDVMKPNNEASKLPLSDISGNRIVPEPAQSVDMNDQSSQTILTSAQIDKALMKKVEVPTTPTTPKVLFSPVPAPPLQGNSGLPPVSPRFSSRTRSQTSESDSGPSSMLPMGVTTPKRPSSSNSVRQGSFSTHPPLPPDHKQVIVAAGGRLPQEAREAKVEKVMGPPIAPASAYKRPRTPAEQALSPSRGGTAVRPRGRPGAQSQFSRRSSVTSFASELDERFNIRADGLPGSHAFEPGTDPRMIQAITQTMIGEFLWKYTRKPGRGEMSNTRHRRYFWVHPYTRTLYWSDQDPQTAGRSELKAKSVAIEAVRVVTDDNPMPPGLHRKSIEVITPGRKVKFTASTGQRHETWFNALSYLLLRNQDGDGNTNGVVADPTQLTAEDVDEFNPGGYNRSSSRMNDRASLSSYNSRTTQNTAIRASSRLSVRQPTTPGKMASQASSSRPRLSILQLDNDSSTRKGSMSRLSNMFKGSIGYRGSSRLDTQHIGEEAAQRSNSGIYNASLVEDRHDSAEDLRREILQQERESDRLENVRACCDGKHDVSSLARGGRHASHKHHSHSFARR